MPPPVALPNINIYNGQTESDVMDFTRPPLNWVAAFALKSPATLPETVKLYGCETAAGTYVVVQSGGSDITLPADKATVIDTVAFPFMRLIAGAAVGADRVFKMTGREDPLR